MIEQSQIVTNETEAAEAALTRARDYYDDQQATEANGARQMYAKRDLDPWETPIVVTPGVIPEGEPDLRPPTLDEWVKAGGDPDTWRANYSTQAVEAKAAVDGAEAQRLAEEAGGMRPVDETNIRRPWLPARTIEAKAAAAKTAAADGENAPAPPPFLKPFPVTVQCPIEGLEAVHVTYNMACVDNALQRFQRSLGQDNAGVVIEIADWPEQLGDPFGGRSPIVFRIWAVKQGYSAAMQLLLNDPKLLTA